MRKQVCGKPHEMYMYKSNNGIERALVLTDDGVTCHFIFILGMG